MKTEHACDIARDLMPLELDGVCSQGSRHFLKSHLETCAPCQEVYQKMKADSVSIELPSMESSQEAALGRRVRLAGKKLKWLYRLLTACGAAAMLFLCILGIQTLRWNHVTKAPLDSYELQLSRFGDFVHVDLAHSFSHLKSVVHDTQVISDGDTQSAVITYSVQYYPVRSQSEQLISPAYQTVLLSTHHFCVKDGLIYTVDPSSIPFISPEQAAESSTIYLNPDLPVSEIRVTDGKETRVLYTQGDELSEKRQPSLNENATLLSGVDVRVGE